MLSVVDHLNRWKSFKTKRGVFEAHWQDLAETMLPRRADFTTQSSAGEKRTGRQFDSVPMMAVRGLASAIDQTIKPRDEKWATIVAGDKEINDRDDVRLWLEDTQDRMFRAIYDPAARFQQASGEVDTDVVVFGTGGLFTGRNKAGTGLSFRALHLKNTYYAENSDGNIDTAYLVDDLTAGQAQQRFGGSLGRRTLEALKDPGQRDHKFQFIEAITPREDAKSRRGDNKNFPVASIVIDVESEHEVLQSGYREFPIATPRWDTAIGEIYGRSPGMAALPDVATLHEVGRTLLEVGQKVANPPLLVASDSIISGPRTFEGGITYFDAEVAAEMGRIPIFPMEFGKNLPVNLEMQKTLRDQVYMAFFRHVLNLPFGGPQMTATEVLERKEEFVRSIGPVFGRLVSDYNAPIIERVFSIMMHTHGAFSSPPPALVGSGVTFVYQNPVEKVRLQTEPLAVLKTMEAMAPITAFQPQAMDQFDGDAIARGVAKAHGMRQEWLRTADEIGQIREQRQQAQSAQESLDAAEKLSGVAKNVPGLVEGT